MAEDSTSVQIRTVEEKLRFVAGSAFNREINSIMNRVTGALEKLQQDFFTIMSQKIVGAKSSPRLGAFSSPWKPLSDEYTERREFEFGTDPNQFFLGSGKLETALYRLNARTIFGKPVVLYKRGDLERKAGQTYSRARDFSEDETYTAHIEIDLYPKVPQDFSSIDEHDLFGNIKIREKKGKKNYTTPLSYRLKNYRGHRDRPVIQAYMQWWLETKARKVIRGELK